MGGLSADGRTRLICRSATGIRRKNREEIQERDLFLEDDDSIRELVIYTLRNTGMEAMGFPRPSAFWEAMQQEELPALVLLDIMLPEEDGVSVLKNCGQIGQRKRCL